MMMKPVLVLFFSLLLLSGCGGTDYQYQNANETKPGPGLLSGDDGVFTLIKIDKPPEKETEETEKTAEEKSTIQP